MGVNMACWAGFATSQVPSLSPSVAPPIVNRLDWAGVRKLNVMVWSAMSLSKSSTMSSKSTVVMPGCTMVLSTLLASGPLVMPSSMSPVSVLPSGSVTV